MVFMSFHPQIFMTTARATPSLISCVAKQALSVWNFTDGIPVPTQNCLKIDACSPSVGPIPTLGATYVVGKDGRIVYSFLDADYKKRAETADLLAALQKLVKASAPAH